MMKPHRVQIPIVSGTDSESTGDQRDDTSNVDRIAEFDNVEATYITTHTHTNSSN